MIVSKEIDLQHEDTYPILKESADYVVLFSCKGVGMVVKVKNEKAPNGVSYMPDFWDESFFTVFQESVVLSNG